MRRVRVGVLDVGSVAAKLEIIDVRGRKPPRSTSLARVPTRLAEGTSANGELDARCLRRLTAAVQQCVRIGSRHDVPMWVTYATAAVRDAANGRHARRLVEAETGLRLGFFTGEQEGRYTFRAAQRWLGGELTMVDIGGGTLEVASGHGPEPESVISAPLGAARLTRQFLRIDPPRGSQVRRLTEVVDGQLAELLRDVPAGQRQFAGAGKVLKLLAQLSNEDAAREDLLLLDDLRDCIPRLSTLDRAGRCALPGVPRARADRILAGAITAEALMRRLGTDQLRICPWGLREGVALREHARHRTGR
ncbi:exopolyphosphatase [Pseudonocardiaceae bacterium YIM PH 21723]|nr:exopolyphosphatase [Pseudonocardiaceae bacterium YIM PH 21723]